MIIKSGEVLLEEKRSHRLEIKFIKENELESKSHLEAMDNQVLLPQRSTGYWKKREQLFLTLIPLPKKLIELIGSYESSTLQKNFINLRLWFQQYDRINKSIEKTKKWLLTILCIAAILQLVLLVWMDNREFKGQLSLQVLSWFNFFITSTNASHNLYALEFPGCQGSLICCIKRYQLHQNLRNTLNIKLENLDAQKFKELQQTTVELLKKSTWWDLNLMRFVFFLTTPFTLTVCILGLVYFSEAKALEGTMIINNTIGLGLATLGLYGDRKRVKKIEAYLENLSAIASENIQQQGDIPPPESKIYDELNNNTLDEEYCNTERFAVVC